MIAPALMDRASGSQDSHVEKGAAKAAAIQTDVHQKQLSNPAKNESLCPMMLPSPSCMMPTHSLNLRSVLNGPASAHNRLVSLHAARARMIQSHILNMLSERP